MGFTINYRSTQRLSPAKTNAIREAAKTLIAGRTWLSCEPVDFYEDQNDGRLLGRSKPNFLPNPDHAASAARESLPDGTVHDMINVLCELSRRFQVDWEFSHDYDPGPIGLIRAGVCEQRLREQMEAFADLGGILQEEMMGDFEAQLGFPPSSPTGIFGRDSDDEADDDSGPSILPFRPQGEWSARLPATNTPLERIFSEQAASAGRIDLMDWERACNRALSARTHWLDSHPCLRDRLAALEVSWKKAKKIKPDQSGPPAAELIDDWDTLESRLTGHLMARFHEQFQWEQDMQQVEAHLASKSKKG
ncbi:MAG: hypothetical protein HY040_22195 [Planctomycetes bacterium]|nr:hypothetical protein [Planctomycetota bacterium]